jgi:hypothetical protein
VGIATGTIATVAMDAPPRSNGSSSSLSRLSTTSTPDEGRFLPGTLVNGRYRIVGLLGRGGMGEVYRATDLTLAHPVALKFLPEAGVTERVLERFHAEVRIARQISHPNVCRVYDIAEVDGQPFISMEYVDGEDLGDLLHRIGRLPADKALETARKICAGLAAAHDKGVIHRDLKPQNIMLNKRGEPVIMDFGLAAVADQMTGAEARNGTPAYMSPEQLRGDEVTARSDIYALGLVLYEIFSGKRAYEANTIGDLLKLQEGAQMASITTLAADVDPQVEKVIKRCLNPDAALRPATPMAVAAALPGGDPLAAALAAGETPSPELVAASGKTEGMDLRYSLPMLLFVVATVVTAALLNVPASVMQRGPVTIPPVVAGHEARKIAAAFGYPAPLDSYVSFTGGFGIKDYWKSHDKKGKSWNELMSAEPFEQYFYRESLEPLFAPPTGQVNSTNPAPVKAGMIDMRLGFGGQLREFQAVPAEKPPGTAGAAFDQAALFKAVAFDPAGFTETPSEWTPMVAYDLRKAWKGPVPGLPDTEARIEVASLAGRISAVKVVFPWTKEEREPSKGPVGAGLYGPMVMIGMTLMAIFFGLIFAIRNLRKNRGDKKGAFRVAMVAGLLAMVGWLGSAHHIASLDEWTVYGNAIADAASTGLVLWILYLALEPAVRARWPQALVTWNRLVAGRFGDAQLGAHILTGAAIGSMLRIVLSSEGWISYRHDGVPFGNNLGGQESVLNWIGANADTMQGALQTGFVVFFTIFGMRQLWKNDYAAAVSTAVMFAIVGNNGVWSHHNPVVEGLLLLAIFFVLALILLRMGMVASAAAIFFINTPDRINLGPGLSGWYTPYGIATIALLLGITVYAFWRSIGERTLGDEVAGR